MTAVSELDCPSHSWMSHITMYVF